MEDFGAVDVFTGEVQTSSAMQQSQTSAMVAADAEKARAIGEVQAALVVARANPRNEEMAKAKLLKACERLGLAEKARFRYTRAGREISGRSIRLAEAAARFWGNLQYGFRELSREGDVSEVIAAAWDLETNVKVERRFTVKLIRDTKHGAKALTSERDRYEVMASQAQRRVRSCIEELIDQDILDEAEQVCIKTFQAYYGANPDERRKQILEAFGKLNITQQQLEQNLGHPFSELTAAEAVRLREIYNSISQGLAESGEFFLGHKVTGNKKSSQGQSEAKEKAQERPSSTPGPKPEPEPEPEPPAEEKPTEEAVRVTDAQLKKMVALRNQMGWTRDQAIDDVVKFLIQNGHKETVTSGKDLTKDQASAWIEYTEQRLAKRTAPPDPQDNETPPYVEPTDVEGSPSPFGKGKEEKVQEGEGEMSIGDRFKALCTQNGIKGAGFKAVYRFLDETAARTGWDVEDLKKEALNDPHFFAHFEDWKRKDKEGTVPPPDDAQTAKPQGGQAEAKKKKGPKKRYECPKRDHTPISEAFCAKCEDRENCNAPEA